jgi:hypothetical protein
LTYFPFTRPNHFSVDCGLWCSWSPSSPTQLEALPTQRKEPDDTDHRRQPVRASSASAHQASPAASTITAALSSGTPLSTAVGSLLCPSCRCRCSSRLVGPASPPLLLLGGFGFTFGRHLPVVLQPLRLKCSRTCLSNFHSIRVSE